MYFKIHLFCSRIVTLLALLLFLASCGLAEVGTCFSEIPGDTRITGSQINTLGRFGNQLYYYLFLKTYATTYGLTLEVPEWRGKRLFGLQDPQISAKFCDLNEYDPNLIGSYQKKNGLIFVNRDFSGYFQNHTSIYSEHKDEIRALFQPIDEIKTQVQSLVDQIRSRGKTLVAMHLRRGDFGTGPFVISPAQWYLNWLKVNWQQLDKPILFIASDSLDQVLADFAPYHPVTTRDYPSPLSADDQNIDFYPDFYVLTQSDVLLISNSSFSTSAALLNQRATSFYRPDFDLKKLVPFDPWSTYPFENWHDAGGTK
jgi:hypothetical protein